jgi:hypothetical protein
MTSRRGFLAAMLAAASAPVFIKSSILMPVKKVWMPQDGHLRYSDAMKKARLENIGAALNTQFGGVVDFFTAGGVLLASVPLGGLAPEPASDGKIQLQFSAGTGVVDCSGTAETYKLRVPGVLEYGGVIGAGGIELDNKAMCTGQEIALTGATMTLANGGERQIQYSDAVQRARLQALRNVIIGAS